MQVKFIKHLYTYIHGLLYPCVYFFSIESFPQKKFFFQLDILNPSVMFDRWSVESYGWSKSVLITDQLLEFSSFFWGGGLLAEIHKTEGLRWEIDLTVTLFYKVPELAEIKLIRHIFFSMREKNCSLYFVVACLQSFSHLFLLHIDMGFFKIDR